jgi:Ni2+-binding GTPase involved in maturation of urease and hydrogenase
LIVEEASTGWLAVTCDSPEMAEWLRAAIVLENVAARADGCRLLLPAGPRYRLADEVKSVITVVAKTHHYWSAHAPVGHPAPPAPGMSRMPRPLKVGVGGPAGSGKTSLIDALCRRLAGRLGVRVIAGAESARDHPDPDFVLIERTGEDLAATLGPSIVDATLGVVDHRAGVELARRGAPVVTRSHLLVVNAFGADAPAARGAAREVLLEGRRGRPVIFADCRAEGGVDEVLDWLEHDLLLGAQLP